MKNFASFSFLFYLNLSVIEYFTNYYQLTNVLFDVRLLTVADSRHSDEHHLPTKTPRSTEHHHLNPHHHTSVTQINGTPSPAQSKRSNLPRKISLSPVLSFKSSKSKSPAASIVSTSGSSAIYDDVAADDERDASSKREDSSGSSGSFFSRLLLRRSSKKKKNVADEVESVVEAGHHDYDDVADVSSTATIAESSEEQQPEPQPQKVPRYHQSQAFINGSLTAAALRNSSMFRQRIEPLNLPVAEPQLSRTRISVNMSSESSSVSPISSYSDSGSFLTNSTTTHGSSIVSSSATSQTYNADTTTSTPSEVETTYGPTSAYGPNTMPSATTNVYGVTTSSSAYSMTTASSTIVDVKERISVQKSHSFRSSVVHPTNKLPYSCFDDPSPSLPANVGLVGAEVHEYDNVAEEASVDGFQDEARLSGGESGAYEAVNLQVESKKEVVEVPAYSNVSVLNTLHINVNEHTEGSTSSSADESADASTKPFQVRSVKLLVACTRTVHYRM